MQVLEETEKLGFHPDSLPYQPEFLNFGKRGCREGAPNGGYIVAVSPLIRVIFIVWCTNSLNVAATSLAHAELVLSAAAKLSTINLFLRLHSSFCVASTGCCLCLYCCYIVHARYIWDLSQNTASSCCWVIKIVSHIIIVGMSEEQLTAATAAPYQF